MIAPAPAWRARAHDRLSTGTFDLLVIGAGIVGSRIALDASRAGLRVALVDAGDFGGATSGASSKLVHGGLRYLSTGQIGLVRSARSEQHALRTYVAPKLVRPFPLVLALHRDARTSPRALAAGLVAYDALSGFRTRSGGPCSFAEAATLVPPLRADRLAGCAVVQEAQTHDSRLTLATVKAAARHGAVVCNHLAVIAFEQESGRLAAAILEDRAGEGLSVVRFRAAVNAAGPWVDALRRLEDPGARAIARLSKGVHVVLPAPDGWAAGLAVWLPGDQAVFAVPWFGVLLVGVTDTAYEGDPSDAEATPADGAGLLDALADVLPPELLARGRTLSSFAGLRVLPLGAGTTLAASREHIVSVGRHGLVSVAGGKLTTHRRIARDALRRLPSELRPRVFAAAEPLAPVASVHAHDTNGLDAATWSHLLCLYGAGAWDVVAYGALRGGLERIHPAAPDVWAQVGYAVEHEWAVTATDITRRRTTLAVRGIDELPLVARERLPEEAVAL